MIPRQLLSPPGTPPSFLSLLCIRFHYIIKDFIPKGVIPVRFYCSLMYCWFSNDVTKIQTKKLSILPRFYFHDALEQLKTNFHTNFRFKRVLGFVIEDA